MQDLLDGLNAVAQQNNTPVYHYSRATGESFRQFWDDHASGSHQVGAVSYYPAERSEVPAFMEMFEKFRKREAPLVIVHKAQTARSNGNNRYNTNQEILQT